MSTTEEKKRAIQWANAFLYHVGYDKSKYKISELREMARRIIRHWPHESEIQIGWKEKK